MATDCLNLNRTNCSLTGSIVSSLTSSGIVDFPTALNSFLVDVADKFNAALYEKTSNT